jgi:hypothetical protein
LACEFAVASELKLREAFLSGYGLYQEQDKVRIREQVTQQSFVCLIPRDVSSGEFTYVVQRVPTRWGSAPVVNQPSTAGVDEVDMHAPVI